MELPIDRMCNAKKQELAVRRMFKGKPAQERFVPTGTYSGEELKRNYSTRAGAFDAFDKCPSLRDGVLHPYVGPKPQCVGVLRDTQALARD